MKKIFWGLLLLCIGLSGCGNSGETDTSADKVKNTGGTDIVAQVGDDVITGNDIELILSQIPAQFRPRYASPKGHRELLDALVNTKMLAWEARRRKINERDDVRVKMDYIVDQALARSLEEELQKKIRIDDAAVKKYYEENRDRYVTPEKIEARHILVDSKAEAEEILAKIRAGGDFAELAREKSKCPSADKGGDLGWFERGKMDPAFEQAAFKLKKGEVSDVVKTSFGYHIIKVENIRKGKTKTLDQARKSIERTLAKEILEKQMDGLRAKIRKDAGVVVNEKYFSSLGDGSAAKDVKAGDKVVPGSPQED